MFLGVRGPSAAPAVLLVELDEEGGDVGGARVVGGSARPGAMRVALGEVRPVEVVEKAVVLERDGTGAEGDGEVGLGEGQRERRRGHDGEGWRGVADRLGEPLANGTKKG